MGRRGAGARVATIVSGARLLALGTVAALALGCAGVEGARPRRSVIRVISLDGKDRLAADIPPGSPCSHMSWPVDGPVSSPFGKRDGRMHDGIDLAVGEDTPVRAACDGVVAYAGNGLRGYGNLVILRHDNALATVYAHNKVLLVKEGQSILRGQTIARSGQTGKATAPHVHFEVRKDSIARNPLGYLHGTMSDGTQKVSARRAVRR